MYFKDHEIQMEICTIPHFRLQRFNKKKLHVNDSKPLKETALSFFLIWGEEKKKKGFNPSSARDNSITGAAWRI